MATRLSGASSEGSKWEIWFEAPVRDDGCQQRKRIALENLQSYVFMPLNQPETRTPPQMPACSNLGWKCSDVSSINPQALGLANASDAPAAAWIQWLKCCCSCLTVPRRCDACALSRPGAAACCCTCAMRACALGLVFCKPLLDLNNCELWVCPLHPACASLSTGTALRKLANSPSWPPYAQHLATSGLHLKCDTSAPHYILGVCTGASKFAGACTPRPALERLPRFIFKSTVLFLLAEMCNGSRRFCGFSPCGTWLVNAFLAVVTPVQ